MGSEQRSGTGGHFVLIGDSRGDGDGKVTLLPLDDAPDPAGMPDDTDTPRKKKDRRTS